MTHILKASTIGVTLSLKDLALIHTLHSELNFFPKSFNNFDKEIKPFRIELIKQLFEIVKLKRNGKVNDEIFSLLFTKWTQARGCNFNDLDLFEMKTKDIFKLEDIIEIFVQLSITNPHDHSSILANTVEILNQNFNTFLCNSANSQDDDERLANLDKSTITIIEQIFKVFDAKEQGNVQIDRVYFLYLSLLMTKPNPSYDPQHSSFISSINQSFHYFLQQIDCFSGRITCRQLKAYLLYHSFDTRSKLEVLYEASKYTTTFGLELCAHFKQHSKTLFPSILPLAIKRTLHKINLSELQSNKLDHRLIAHYFFTRFYSIVWKHNFQTGLHLKHKNNLCQFLTEDFYRYYSLASHTIYWNVQITQTFLTIIQNFALYSLEILQFSQNWLFTHRFSFKVQKKEKSNSPIPEQQKRSKSALRHSEKIISERDQNYKKKIDIWSYLVEQNQPAIAAQKLEEFEEEPAEGRQKRLYSRSRSKAFRLSKSPPQTIFEESKVEISPLILDSLRRKQKSEEDQPYVEKISLLFSQNSPPPVRMSSQQLQEGFLTLESARNEVDELQNEPKKKEQFQFERKALQRRLTNEKEKEAHHLNSSPRVRTSEGAQTKRENAIKELEEMKKRNEKALEYEREMLEGVLHGDMTNESFNTKLKKLQNITKKQNTEDDTDLVNQSRNSL